jgi:hypothetical protein
LAEELNFNGDGMVKKISAIHNYLFQRNEIAALDNVKSLIRDLAAVYRDGFKIQNNNRVSKAKQVLEEQFTSGNISLTTVAEKVGINPD